MTVFNVGAMYNKRVFLVCPLGGILPLPQGVTLSRETAVFQRLTAVMGIFYGP